METDSVLFHSFDFGKSASAALQYGRFHYCRKFVGSEALAAVGSSGSLINLLISFCMGASAGAGVVIAQYYGANDKRECRMQCIQHWRLQW